MDTGIDIRDDRMRKRLFETGMFPTATISGEIDVDKYREMKAGEHEIAELELELSLHGNRHAIKTEAISVGHALSIGPYPQDLNGRRVIAANRGIRIAQLVRHRGGNHEGIGVLQTETTIEFIDGDGQRVPAV